LATATVPETIEKVFKPIQQFTRGWMMTEATASYGVELGLRSGHDFWVIGRAGVLGSCPADVAVAALAFHAPDGVRDAWEHVPPGLTHYQVAEHYRSRVVAWGAETLAPFDPDRMERLDALGRRVADAAPACLGVVFAGWRDFPAPDDVGARVALTTQVLREMRGAAHINAIIACGLTPLDAHLASTNAPPRSGPAYAERMGFEGPFRDPEEVREARLEAEVLTARILEPFFATLAPEELADFGEVVATTRAAIDM
jgi:hypothetical protein